MKDYALVICMTLILAWIIENTYVISPDALPTKSKNNFSLFLIFALLALYIGLRTRYNDTDTYLAGYEIMKKFPDFWETYSTSLGDNPGFFLVNGWLKTNNVSGHSFLLLYAAMSVACSIWFIKKYNHGLCLTFFLFFTTNSYMISGAAVKQSAAIALGLISVKFALEHKWIRFALLICVAATFHPYVLVYLLVPFLMFRPWEKRTYLMLAIFIAVGFGLESLLGTIIDLTTMIGDSYSEEALIGDGISVFRVIVSNMPLALSFLYRKRLFNNSTREENLMINVAILNGAIMFVGLFGTAIYFSRLASYFTIFQCIALPLIINKLPKQDRQFFKISMIAGYVGFFMYANVMINSFDSGFARMTLGEYLRSIR